VAAVRAATAAAAPALGRALALAALAGVGACEHAQPFGAPAGEPNVPQSVAFPRQLTFNPAPDFAPSWLPDGSGFIYSFSLGRFDNDFCLGLLPAEGGHRTATICHAPLFGDADSSNVLSEPAVGPGGALAYLRAGSLVGALSPKSLELVAARMGAPDPGRVLVRFPYTAPDSLLHTGASRLHWIGDTCLVYLALQVTYLTQGTFADTLVAPLEIVRLSLAGDSAALALVPGTLGATSLAVDSAGMIVYTLAGDTHVYRRDAAGAAAPAVLYDFGTAGVPADLQLSGSVLVATIGNRLVRATVGDPVVSEIPSPDSTQALRRPALAPSGARVVIELKPANAPADLWLLEVR
jgi:hypothetical protein